MPDSAIETLALNRAIEVGSSIESQIGKIAEGGPVLAVLAKARAEAAAAMVLLVQADPTDAELIMQLQNEVRRYDDLVRWFGELVAAGMDADAQMKRDELEELRGLLGTYAGTPEGAEAGADEFEETQ